MGLWGGEGHIYYSVFIHLDQHLGGRKSHCPRAPVGLRSKDLVPRATKVKSSLQEVGNPRLEHNAGNIPVLVWAERRAHPLLLLALEASTSLVLCPRSDTIRRYRPMLVACGKEIVGKDDAQCTTADWIDGV